MCYCQIWEEILMHAMEIEEISRIHVFLYSWMLDKNLTLISDRISKRVQALDSEINIHSVTLGW
jgi:hypothetical protein